MRKKIIEGQIIEVREGLLITTVTDNDDASGKPRTYHAEIDLDRFAGTDQPHCVPGALFTITDPGPELKLLRRKSKTVSAPAYGSDS